MKVRFTDLSIIPRSIRWSEGEEFEEESWTSYIEVLQHVMLGGGQADEDHIPPPGADLHPIPLAAFEFPGFNPGAFNMDVDDQAEE